MCSKLLSGWILLATVVFLASCGGGGGGGSYYPAGDQATGGIWEGTWTGGGGEEDVIAFSTEIDSESGQARFSLILIPSLIQIAGTVTVDGTTLTGTGIAYAPAGDSFPGGVTTTGISFTGVLRERQSLDGNWEIDAGESGSLSLDFSEEYMRGADLDRLEGNWTLYDIDLNPVGTFTFVAGDFLRVTAGCTSAGAITIPDPQFNMYSWAATVTSNSPGSCPIAGDFTGLGVLTDSEDSPPEPLNDEFDVLVNSDTLAIPLLMLREP